MDQSKTPMEQVVDDACRKIESSITGLFHQAQTNLAQRFPPREEK